MGHRKKKNITVKEQAGPMTLDNAWQSTAQLLPDYYCVLYLVIREFIVHGDNARVYTKYLKYAQVIKCTKLPGDNKKK